MYNRLKFFLKENHILSHFPEISFNTFQCYFYRQLNISVEVSPIVKKIKEDCKQFVGLDNVSDPKSGAFAYFSAAIRENYGEMMVQQKEKRPGLRPKLQSFSIHDPQYVKKHYDPETGKIGHCGCNDYVCKAHDAYLFFCKF